MMNWYVGANDFMDMCNRNSGLHQWTTGVGNTDIIQQSIDKNSKQFIQTQQSFNFGFEVILDVNIHSRKLQFETSFD